MKILDLFCGAGGAAMGLHRAFPDAQILGVDIEPQPHYPFIFVQADAMEFPLGGFDFIWASPPCQRYTKGAGQKGTRANWPDLVAPTRSRLEDAGTPWVIENVPQAPLRNAVELCGQSFGLGVFRHRRFESSFVIRQPIHDAHDGRVGDGRYFTVAGHTGGTSRRDGWVGGSVEDWRRAMGIDWMGVRELAEAVPPAYAEYVGRQFRVSRLEVAA